VLFLAENKVVAGGFDFKPMLFIGDNKGIW
jgi:hypothetical protein